MKRLWTGTTSYFSADRRYRYALTRDFGQPFLRPQTSDRKVVAFIGLNPSTADERDDDPTVRRCLGYAKTWGMDGLVMLNLFAFRSTDPEALYDEEDPRGDPDNMARIVASVKAAAFTVCCWGNHGSHLLRGSSVLAHLRAIRPKVELRCLRITQEGQPAHPLYLPARLEPVKFNPKGGR